MQSLSTEDSQYKQQDCRIIEKVSLKQKLGVESKIRQKSEIMISKFGSGDSMVACGYGDGYLRVYNLLKGSRIIEVNTNIKDKQSKNNTPITALRWRPSNQQTSTLTAVLLVANANGHLYQYIAKTGKEIYHGVQQDNQIFAVDYAPDGKAFATAGKDNIVRIYDEETKKVKEELKGELRHKTGHNNRLFAVKFRSNNANIVASGGWDQNIQIWDLRVKEATSSLYGPKITGDAIDFREDIILTGANRVTDQLQLWDYRTKQTLYTFKWSQHQKQTNTFLNSCQFCPNSKNTVIAAGGNQMKMFTLDDHTELFSLRTKETESVFTCDSSSISNKYIAAGKNGILYYMSSKHSQF